MKERPIRLALIIGACLCLVIGGKWIAEDIVYHIRLVDSLVMINALAFVPIIAIAPQYKNGMVIYLFIGALEAFIIFMGNILTLR
jgi:hypothetical protein